MKKIVILILVAAVAAGAFYMMKGGAQAPGGGHPGMGGAMPPAEVSVITITPQPLDFTRDLPGRTSSYRVAEIRPQVNGIITKRLYEEGSEIKEGQQLYQIDPATYQAAYNSAMAGLVKAEASLKVEQVRYDRNQSLVKSGAVSKQRFDDVRAAMEQAKADVGIARAALAAAKIDLDYTKVFSPISGRIGKSFVTEGALVTANQANALAVVQQLDPIYVDVTQSSTELMELRSQLSADNKTPVKLLLNGESRIYEHAGELQFSDVSVDPTTGSVQLRVLFPNPKHELLPGLFVRARIEQAHDTAAILVPQKSVMRNADGSVTVWVIGKDDKAAIRPITISHAIGDQWLVLNGLEAGERVVLEGIQKIAPGAAVKPVPAQTNQAQPGHNEPAPPKSEDAANAVAPETQPQQAE